MVLALFDLDDTLLDGDCERLWCEFLAERGLVDEGFLTRIGQFFEDYADGSMDFIAYETFFLSPLINFNAEGLIELRSQYLKQINVRLRSFMLERLQWHREQAHQLVLITASNAFLAQPIAQMLDIPHVICTEIEMLNHKLTGKVLGMPPFREGKVACLKLWMAEHAQTLDESWAYSDSHNDLPILREVTHAVAVTPDDILRAQAHERGWKILP
jgi:HAD superfamily hydrolase (TIGR01490 family)